MRKWPTRKLTLTKLPNWGKNIYRVGPPTDLGDASTSFGTNFTIAPFAISLYNFETRSWCWNWGRRPNRMLLPYCHRHHPKLIPCLYVFLNQRATIFISLDLPFHSHGTHLRPPTYGASPLFGPKYRCRNWVRLLPYLELSSPMLLLTHKPSSY